MGRQSSSFGTGTIAGTAVDPTGPGGVLIDPSEITGPVTPTVHDLAGAEHAADTLADLNSKISDATLDDVGGLRTPVQATETIIGGGELATQAETDAGTDDLRIVTPLKLTNFSGLGGAPDASETVKGIAELATQVETDIGTDDLRIVTPLKLATTTQVKKHTLSFGTTGGVPGGGTRYLDHEGIAVTSSPVLLPAAAVLRGITITVDSSPGATREYEVRVISDPGGADTLIGSALTLTSAAVSADRRDLTGTIGAGVKWGVVLVRTAGSGPSSFSDARAEVEVQMP